MVVALRPILIIDKSQANGLSTSLNKCLKRKNNKIIVVSNLIKLCWLLFFDGVLIKTKRCRIFDEMNNAAKRVKTVSTIW